MKRGIDGRSFFTYVDIVAVGLFLLLLVSPSFGGSASLGLLTLLAAVLPLVFIVGLLFYLLGKSKKTVKSFSRNLSKNLATIGASGIILSVVMTYLSTKQPAFEAHTLRYAFENIGVALLFVAFVCALLLINNQKFVYWPFWNTNDQINSDERQRAVRQRVFEKAYRLNIVVLIVASFLAHTPSQRLKDELFQVIALCLLGVPAIIAGWQKDS